MTISQKLNCDPALAPVRCLGENCGKDQGVQEKILRMLVLAHTVALMMRICFSVQQDSFAGCLTGGVHW
jgi:hypothetical protein